MDAYCANLIKREAAIDEVDFKLVEYLPHEPDLASSAYRLFPELKQQ